jgi:hypothetical protein
MSSHMIAQTRKYGQVLPRAAYWTLWKIAHYADQQGRNAYPRLRTIAKGARYSEGHTRRQLRLLETLGFLTTEQRAGPNGANLYTMHFPGSHDTSERHQTRRGHWSKTPQREKNPDVSFDTQKPDELQKHLRWLSFLGIDANVDTWYAPVPP